MWEIWLVPLIALAVWILGSLMRGGAEERQRNQPRPGGGGDAEGGRPTRRPANDLDSFLQEVHRRRQATEQRRAEPRREVPTAVEEPVSRPKPPPRRQPRSVPPPPPRRQPSRSVESAPVEVVVVSQAPTAQPVTPFPVVVEVPPPPPTVTRTPPPTRPRAAVRPLSPSLAVLLSSPAALRNAIILREIFDPPLSKRKR